MKLSAVLSTLALALTSPVVAQPVSTSSGSGSSPPGPDPTPDPDDIELIVPGRLDTLPVSSLGAVPKRIVSGQFTDDTLLDLMLTDGSSEALIYGVDVFGNTWANTFPIEDVAAYPVAGEMQDRLLVVTSAGLESWVYDPEGTVIRTGLGSSAWSSARSLAVGNLGGGGAPDLAGLSATGEVLVLMDIPTYPESEVAFSPDSFPYELVVLDWDHDGVDEIVARTERGLRIHEADGGFVDSIRSFHPEGAMAPLRLYGADGLAWVTRNRSGGEESLVLLSSVALPQACLLGPAGTGAMAAGDLNGDGLQDLAIRRGDEGEVLLLVNGGDSFDPTTEESAQVLEGKPGDGADGQPCFVDLDRDGDLDLVWGFLGGAGLTVLRSSVVVEAEQAPGLVEVRFDVDEDGGQAYFRLRFNDGDWIPEHLTHLQATLFRQGSPQDPTEVLAHDTLLTPIAPLLQGELEPGGPSLPLPGSSPGAPSQGILPGSPEGGGGNGGVESPYPDWLVTLDETDKSFPALYFLVVRYVQVVGSGTPTIVETAPARIHGFTTETSDDVGTGGSLDYLLSIGDSQGWFTALPDVFLEEGQEAELEAVGTLIEVKPVPKIEDNEKPEFSGS